MNFDPSVDNGQNSPSTLPQPSRPQESAPATSRRASRSRTAKVERSHRIDEEEFWSQRAFSDFAVASATLEVWRHRYNYDRFSMALNGQTPTEKLADFHPGTASAVPIPLPSPA